MAARYSRVERRVHRDEKFRKLPRDARTLWLYLLTCDAHGGFPGLFLLRLSSAAEDISADDDPWTPGRVVQAFAKIAAVGMAQRDPDSGVVWLPNAIRRHESMMANHARGWRAAWDELPDCTISRSAFSAAVESMRSERNADALVSAFMQRPPSWWGAVSPWPAPAQPLVSPCLETPKATDSPSPAGTGTGTGTGTGVEGLGSPSPTLRDPEGEDLFGTLVEEQPDAFPGLPRVDLARAAAQMDRRVERESGGRAHGGPYLTLALGALATWIADHPDASPARRLAELVKLYGYKVGDDARNDYAAGVDALRSLRALDGAA